MDMMDKLGTSPRLSDPDLRCKNKCGFYGNPIYLGYCSKCFKELVRDAPKDSAREGQTTDEQLYPGASASGSSGLGFGKFNMKKKVFATAKGRGKLFKSGSPLRFSPGAIPFPETKRWKRGEKDKSPRVMEPFNEFLKTIRKPAAQDIVTQLKTFHKQITEKSTATVEEQSEAVQEFYTVMAERLRTHLLFKTMTDEQQEDMMDGIEKHLMTNIYQNVYSLPSCDDEMKDLLLQRRIRMLHWVEPRHLDIVLDLQKPEVQDLVSEGRQALWDMDTKKAPRDKLNCISKCCQHVFNALRISQEAPASADEFVPSLIFMVIYTSPQHLHSNVNYISRFSNPMRLMNGEAGYYFTNLCGAIYFIENITAEGLKMDEEEFNKKMGYVDGKTDGDLLLEEADVMEEKERVMVLKSCCQAMKELTDRLQLMLVEARELEVQMREFKAGLKEQVDAILTTPPHRSIAFHQREEERDLINLEWSEEYTAGTGRPVRVAPPPPA